MQQTQVILVGWPLLQLMKPNLVVCFPQVHVILLALLTVTQVVKQIHGPTLVLTLRQLRHHHLAMKKCERLKI